MSAELTLGAEEELHLIDLESWQLSARAPQLLSRLPSANYSAEIQRTTVETNTDVVDSLDGLRAELLRLRRGLTEVAAAEGLGAAAVGTAPRSGFADFELTSTGRYGRMQEQYRLLVDEQLICGLQIHVGVSDRDLAVAIMQRVARDLPVLLALSASSPYWNGQDTGYASIRTIIWQRWPSAGATGPLASAEAYDSLIRDLINTGVIADAKMAYFDVRPSAHAPTLELRVCDACPIVDDAVLIAGLFRAAVRRAELDIANARPFEPVAVPIHRAAIWRAARGGLASEVLDHTRHPQPIPADRAVRALVARLRPQLEELGDWDQVKLSDRHHAWSAATPPTGSGPPWPSAANSTTWSSWSSRRPGAPRRASRPPPPPCVPIVCAQAMRRWGSVNGRGRSTTTSWTSTGRPAPPNASNGESSATNGASTAGMTFGVESEQRPFAVDLMPRVVNEHEWKNLSDGLLQRARAVEFFLQDVYSEQRVLADGILDRDLVLNCPGWRQEATRLPPGTVRGPVMGFDLVRNEFGGWRVLEDNLRNPSGAAYALAIRDLMDAVLPDLPRPAGLLDPADSLPALRDCLLDGFGPDGNAALLSSGPGSSAWFEHQLLAERARLLLLTADDLQVRDGRVVARGETPVDALYLRLDDELVDLTNSAGQPIGADVFEVAVAGRVRLANAPGNGVADDKSMYCYVPELIAYYLDERPLLESVPTYRTSDAAECRIVLERVGELVTKPVDGHGGLGVLIGPDASASQVAARRAEIAAHPDRWVAQEVVALSSHPTFAGELLEPRHVDLRAFVYLWGTEPGQSRLAHLALTRVAPEGSLVVNSSRGGGAKDTWIIGGER